MRLVVDDHNTADMKCLSDFDRTLNLVGELNSDFPYSGIIQLKKNMDDEIILMADSNIYLHGDRVGFEEKVNSLWKLCFGDKPPVKFDYGMGYHSSNRQIGNGC